ncbi:hypothetical protein SAMN05421676_101406 [Salinibacillus kushneri]|uniref:Uncharacterized protein n=1 Tax=Salinibacillus kushneri TaxID=237682 RepID=A0A1H9Z687_9BACI|nr:hypothetical protein [Salinibacillus kushneri]SES77016.1 hypothetical protein SAMN05421676_101406 [Salinibacillus kushneri]
MNCQCTFTKDTNRRLIHDEGVFFNEISGEYYDSKIRLIIDCLKEGMSKEEVRIACDVDSDSNEAGYIFWTTFEEDSCAICSFN